MSMSEERTKKSEHLKNLILEAFEENPYPGDDNIAPHGCLECSDITDLFRGTHWKDWLDKPMEVISRQQDCIPMLSREACRFYMPLFLFAVLDHYEEAKGYVFIGSIVWEFTPPKEQPRTHFYDITPEGVAAAERKLGKKIDPEVLRRYKEVYEKEQLEQQREPGKDMLVPGKDMLEYCEKRMHIWSPRQREVLKLFLEFLRDEHPDLGLNQDIGRALGHLNRQ